VSPLLVGSKEAFQAAYTQAIGRVRRMGQTKMVHIYHLLAIDTLDVDILESKYNVKLLLQRDKSNRETLEVLTTKEEYDQAPATWLKRHSKDSLILGSRPYRISLLGEEEEKEEEA
jgi:SNF2 family DNA or RNA helicase